MVCSKKIHCLIKFSNMNRYNIKLCSFQVIFFLSDFTTKSYYYKSNTLLKAYKVYFIEYFPNHFPPIQLHICGTDVGDVKWMQHSFILLFGWKCIGIGEGNCKIFQCLNLLENAQYCPYCIELPVAVLLDWHWRAFIHLSHTFSCRSGSALASQLMYFLYLHRDTSSSFIGPCIQRGVVVLRASERVINL